MKIKINHADYKLLGYEVEFIESEISFLLDRLEGDVLEYKKGSFHYIECPCIEREVLHEYLDRLTYTSSVEVYANDGEPLIFFPIQAKYEKSCPKTGGQKRQTTRYGAHGLHEYKGKFNPQIVSAIANLFNLSHGAQVLEPFCGSGTTLYQSELMGMKSNGFDFNPLAVYIANTKLASINADNTLISNEIKGVVERARLEFEKGGFSIESNERSDYLEKWFDMEQLAKIEILKSNLDSSDINKISKDICFCIASDLIREYSQQDPADLRIRRRKSPLPLTCFFSVLISKMDDFLERIKSIGSYIEHKDIQSEAFNVDIRDTEKLSSFSGYDAAITSPPYATALPYIDTQRLSLIWLELASPREVKYLDNNLIGSRELSKKEERAIKEQIETNSDNIPSELHSLCLDMLDALGEGDGFRRQAMPYVVYRYFADMKLMFTNVLTMLKPDGLFGLVVGHNQTTLGGKLFLLDTPNYLKSIAEGVGWTAIENISLDVYKRYDLHKANSINTETLVVLKK
ncbi:DNA methylase [Vibrio splendidus]|uniref:DNA methylase n=1 Tax=Vibrio splendidus TaxID=29497 RepID=UPI000C83389C|nr:DNA methylase [Vibrio splendidus]PMN23466.1 hypothetical protein BCT36_16350 [Vibrio splendidus]